MTNELLICGGMGDLVMPGSGKFVVGISRKEWCRKVNKLYNSDYRIRESPALNSEKVKYLWQGDEVFVPPQVHWIVTTFHFGEVTISIEDYDGAHDKWLKGFGTWARFEP